MRLICKHGVLHLHWENGGKRIFEMKRYFVWNQHLHYFTLRREFGSNGKGCHAWWNVVNGQTYRHVHDANIALTFGSLLKSILTLFTVVKPSFSMNEKCTYLLNLFKTNLYFLKILSTQNFFFLCIKLQQNFKNQPANWNRTIEFYFFHLLPCTSFYIFHSPSNYHHNVPRHNTSALTKFNRNIIQ